MKNWWQILSLLLIGALVGQVLSSTGFENEDTDDEDDGLVEDEPDTAEPEPVVAEKVK